MKQAVIENPVINSPFDEPRRHFRFSDEGITNEIVAMRRTSSYFIPITAPKKKGKEQYFDTEWTQARVEENKFINQVRTRVAAEVTRLKIHPPHAQDQSLLTSAATTVSTPPVFIVVCNKTNVSKLVFDHVAGWEKQISEDKSVVVPGKLALFSNETNGTWTSRPKTILVDSAQLKSGEAMSDDFKQIAAWEIDECKADYRLRFPGRDPDELADEDLLREVVNTVGKPGKLGEQIRCVVSVSMLTEGWNANTVKHILGTLNGEEHNYYPDFIVGIDDGHGPEDLLNLILECTGQKRKDKEGKVTTAQML